MRIPLLVQKWFHRYMIRRDQARVDRLMMRWPIERGEVDRAYVREIKLIRAAISQHQEALTNVESERMWERAKVGRHG